MICICDYCSTEKDIKELVEMKDINKVKATRLCLKCWVKYKIENGCLISKAKREMDKSQVKILNY